ncbi:MAG: hypothetical protein H8E37_12090 [Planctomycetes bacterium]|nr:hypothetical protein [Planctomycetota bacterium]
MDATTRPRWADLILFGAIVLLSASLWMTRRDLNATQADLEKLQAELDDTRRIEIGRLQIRQSELNAVMIRAGLMKFSD